MELKISDGALQCNDAYNLKKINNDNVN